MNSFVPNVDNFEFYIKALEAANASIVITDTQGILLYVNHKFEQVTGYTAEESIGQNCQFLQIDGDGVQHKDQPGIVEIRKALQELTACDVVLENFTRSGELFINQLAIAPIADESGKVNYFVGVQYDITEKVSYAERLKQAEIENQTKKVILEILNNVNHEFRTPLTHISTSMYIAEKYFNSHDQVNKGLSKLKAIHNNVQHLRQLLDATTNLYDFYLQPANQTEIIDVLSMLNEAVERFNLQYENQLQGVEIDFQALNETIYIKSSHQIINAFIEILRNAANHNPGDVKVTIQFYKTETGQVIIMIQDDGRGIAAKNLEYVFEPYHRDAEPIKRFTDSAGFGVGLTLAKLIVEQNNGTIDINSEEGEGARVCVRLPESIN